MCIQAFTLGVCRLSVIACLPCPKFSLSLSLSLSLSPFRYDFGITAWSVLMLKTKGAEGVSELYDYLATHGEVLGILVACAPIGGFVEGLVGSKVKQSS